jgi:hypothetical protein
MMTDQLKPGDWVVYVPNHVHGSLLHKDCERGTVTSIVNGIVFVRYAVELHAKATSPEDLVSAEEYYAALRSSKRQRQTGNGHGFRAYLGDGLYADFDGTNIVLSAENGIAAHDTVYLDLHVLDAFKRWHASRIAPLYQAG